METIERQHQRTRTSELLEPTEKPQKVLAAIHVAQGLPSVLTVARLDLFVDVIKLWPLEPVEKNASKGLVEVLLDARDDLFENVSISRPWSSMDAFRVVVVAQELGDWCGRRHGYELLFLGNFLPIIDQDRFKGIGNE